MRHRDLHLLTVGKETYTQGENDDFNYPKPNCINDHKFSDQRFQSVHNPHNGDWSLKVNVQLKREKVNLLLEASHRLVVSLARSAVGSHQRKLG